MEFLEGEYLYERRWAIAAISIGIFLGLVSALICIIWHLVIFGFNIMYIVSPLLAGVVETYIARKKYGRSTGAISALLTFLLINIYGWFLPGTLVDPTKEPASLSLITIIAILLTLQAAFPTLMNYILFVVGVGIFRKFIEL
ncbi:MAG: YbjQ family protein, partial [Methanobacterium sp.]